MDVAAFLEDLAGAAAGDRGQAEALSRHLGQDQLAVSLAGRYIAESRRHITAEAIVTMPGYRAALYQRGVGIDTSDHPDGVTGHVLAMSLELLDERRLGQARTLLRLLACLPPVRVPLLMLAPAVMAESELFWRMTPAAVEELVVHLQRLGLIDVEPNEGHLALHPVIHRFMAQDARDSGQEPACRTLLAMLIYAATRADAAGPPDKAHAAVWELLVVLAVHIFHAVLDLTAADLVRAADSAAFGTQFLVDTGRAAQARDIAVALYQGCLQELGLVDDQTIICHAFVGSWTGIAGDAVAAHEIYRAVVAEWEQLRGPYHRDTVAARTNLVYWAEDAVDHVSAHYHFGRLAEAHELLEGPDSLLALEARFDAAFHCGMAGDPAAARDQLAVLHERMERVLGAEHLDVLTTANSLARWTGEAGDPVTAYKICRKVLPIRVKVSGPEDPDTLADRSNLARWTGEAGDAAAARDQYAALLPDVERILGPEHAKTVLVRERLDEWTRRAAG